MDESRTVIRHRLTPAALVYREKLLLRDRSDLPDNLVELPAFTFEWPVKDLPEGAEKLFVKGMIHLVGSALAELPLAQGDQFQFVSLTRVRITPAQYQFSFQCPYAEIVQGVARRIEDARSRGLGRGIASGMDVDFKLALPSGILMPLVFAYQHGKNRLLAINQNHISNPDQFLDPETCRATSGFLNFLGTLSVLQATSDRTDYLEKIVAQANSLMNRGLDEWLRWLYELTDSSVLLNQARILIDPSSPETYYYAYSGPAAASAES